MTPTHSDTPELGRDLTEAALALAGVRGRIEVHPDVAEKFIAVAIADGAMVPNPGETDGAFRLALQWAYARMGGDVGRF